MDTIQRILIKAGRKDLAQKYYKKIAAKTKFNKGDKVKSHGVSGIIDSIITPKEFKKLQDDGSIGRSEKEQFYWIKNDLGFELLRQSEIKKI